MDNHADSKEVRDGETVIVSETPAVGDLYERRLSVNEWAKYRHTKRGLTPRHVQLMGIGGSASLPPSVCLPIETALTPIPEV
jgi:amino acid permease